MPELYFGGSFNPIHNAHLRCATAAAVAGGFAGVALVPNGQPALKNNLDVAPAADRLAMLNIAVDEWAGPIPVRVEPLELGRPGVTYTIDTALILKNGHPDRINWLIGADQLLNLHRWHRYGELLSAVQFWVMARPGYAIDWAAVDPAARGLANYVLAVPAMDVSATAIRERLRHGLPVDEWIAPGVEAYIRAHSLYIHTSRQHKLAD